MNLRKHEKEVRGRPMEKAKPQAAEICAICGRPLTQRGPDWKCLRCLFNWGFLPEGEESDQGPAAHRRVTAEPLKYAHFEVEVGADGFPVALGAGAMAITYRARDTVLNSVVALKVIDRKMAENPATRSRFLREARAAAQIRHPNVARVTNYGEQDGECFYAMELVEGETLEARVRRDGPMPLALALEVIEQAARALAAAEACGVVHRDLKPSNLMIESDASESLVVKVIDYGVAKVIAEQAEIGADQTRGGFIGTPAFASPEQFVGTGQTPVDSRSDIYSLGVTLWYLLCGRTPFIGRTLEEIRARQFNDLPLEHLKAAQVPAPVVELLKSMLEVDPSKRPQSARELLAAVHRCYLRFEPQTRSRRKRFAITAALSAVVIAAIALGMWWYASARSSAQIERSIAVLPFQNLSPGNEDAFFTVGMQDEITGDLARLADMKVIGAQSARSYLPDKRRDLPVIGRELGVRYLLEGSVWRADGQMRVSLRLVDTRDSDHPWTETYERSITDVFALQSEIARAIATQLKTRLSPNETAALDLPPTSDLRAYDLYLEAHQIQPPTKESSISSIFSNGQRAIQLLNEAIARDPGFALAYCDLARWHDDLHFLREAGPPEELAVDHRGLAELALDKARRLDPDSGALHLELAIHALQINRNVEEAEIQVQLARRSLPNDAQVESIAGRVARRKDQWDEAVRCLERAVSLEPRDPSLRSLLAETYRFGRRYDDFARNMSVLIGLTPLERTGFLPIERALGELEHSADVAPLRTAFGTQLAAHRLDDDQISAAEMLIAVWSHDNGAISRLVAAKHVEIGFNGIGYPDAWFEALSARIRGDNPAAMAAFARARMQIEKVALSRSFDGNPLGVLAIIDAGLGHKEQAIEEAKRACDLSLFEANNLDAPTVRCDLAIVYAWTGESDLAISELTKLIDRAAGSNVIFQPTYGDFRLSPVWDPLRSDPRFQALVKRLAPTASN